MLLKFRGSVHIEWYYILSTWLLIWIGISQVECCLNTEFECTNSSICILLSKVCDYNFDCTGSDNSDETICNAGENCPEGGIRCPDKTCATSLADCSVATTEESSSMSMTRLEENNSNNKDDQNGWIPIVIVLLSLAGIAIVVILEICFGKLKPPCKKKQIAPQETQNSSGGLQHVVSQPRPNRLPTTPSLEDVRISTQSNGTEEGILRQPLPPIKR